MSKSITKIIGILVLIFALVSLLASCKDKTAGNNPPENPPSDSEGGNTEKPDNPDIPQIPEEEGCEQGKHGETYTQIENEIEATCYVSGSYEEVTYCKECGGEIFRDRIEGAAPQHIAGAEQRSIVEEARCDYEGTELVMVKCERCGEVLSSHTEKIAALSHIPGAPIKEHVVEAACSKAGSYYENIYCTLCGSYISGEKVTVKPLGHTKGDPVIKNETEATCNSDGYYYETYYCTVCNKAFSSSKVTIPKLGHTPGAPVKENIKDACNYEIATYCSNCGMQTSREYVTADTAEHTPGETVTVTIVSATCSAEGKQEVTLYCADCNYVISVTEAPIPKKEHTPRPSSSSIIEPATCTEDGIGSRKIICKICREHIGDESYTIDALGHDFVEGSEEIISNPTCTQVGYAHKLLDCSRCDATDYTARYEIASLGHNTTTYQENNIAPTCTEKGGYDIVTYCERCDSVLNKQWVEIAAKGHIPLDPVTENSVESTCTESGSYDTVVYCETCDAELSRETITLNPLGHTPLDAVVENSIDSSCAVAGSYDTVVYCDVCEAELSRETITLDKLPHSFELVTCTECGATAECNEGVDLVLNDDGRSYTVTSISGCNDEVVYLTVKDGIPVTKVNALSGSKETTTVILGDDVAEIDENTYFGGQELILLEANEHFKVMNGALYTADGKTLVRFLGCDGVSEFVIDDSISLIYRNAFCENDKIVTLRINSGINYVPNLSSCSALKAVYTKDIITYIGQVFQGCPSLEITSINGSYTYLGELTYENCTSLAEMVIPKSLTNINGGAFWGGSYPEIIYYMGSESEWKGLNYYLMMGKNATVYYYTETRPLMPGNWWHFVDDVPTPWPELPEGEGTKGLEYQINDDLESYTLVGYGSFEGPDLIIPSTYNDLPVTAININIFGISFIESIVIPDSVTYIRNRQFEEYANLRSVTLSENLTTLPDEIFRRCTSLTEVNFGENSRITEIGNSAFAACSALANIELPNSVAAVGDSAFYGTAYANNADNWENNVLYIGQCLVEVGSISGEYTVKAGTTVIAGEAFYGKHLSGINLPEGIIYIGERAFYWNNMKNIELPASVRVIEDNAFLDCYYLENISVAKDNQNYKDIDGSLYTKDGETLMVAICDSTTDTFEIPYGVITINRYAFSNVRYSYVDIPSSVINIADYAFYNSGIESIAIPKSVTYLGDSAFGNCSSLTSVVFEDGINLAVIEGSAFSFCSSLTSIVIPDSVVTIESYAFNACSSLTSVTFESDSIIEVISSSAFTGCTKLQTVEIPHSVTSILRYAFYNCQSLTDIYYGGSAEEWNALVAGVDIALPDTVTIHYNSEI